MNKYATGYKPRSKTPAKVRAVAVIAIFAGLFAWTGFQPEQAPPAPPVTPTEAYITASELEQVIIENMTEEPLTIEEKISKAAKEYGVSESAALAIAGCESSMNPYAASTRSSAKGLYQFTDRTWKYIKAQGHQFDVDENIHQFMVWYPIHPEWWVCE